MPDNIENPHKHINRFQKPPKRKLPDYSMTHMKQVWGGIVFNRRLSPVDSD